VTETLVGFNDDSLINALDRDFSGCSSTNNGSDKVFSKNTGTTPDHNPTDPDHPSPNHPSDDHEPTHHETIHEKTIHDDIADHSSTHDTITDSSIKNSELF
jgi:hypothetical protein